MLLLLLLLLFSVSLLPDVATSARHQILGLAGFLSTSSFLGVEALTSELPLTEAVELCETLTDVDSLLLSSAVLKRGMKVLFM